MKLENAQTFILLPNQPFFLSRRVLFSDLHEVHSSRSFINASRLDFTLLNGRWLSVHFVIEQVGAKNLTFISFVPTKFQNFKSAFKVWSVQETQLESFPSIGKYPRKFYNLHQISFRYLVRGKTFPPDSFYLFTLIYFVGANVHKLHAVGNVHHPPACLSIELHLNVPHDFK